MNREVMKTVLLKNQAYIVNKAKNDIQNADIVHERRCINFVNILFYESSRWVFRERMRMLLEINK
jgi:hypothetical protein